MLPRYIQEIKPNTRFGWEIVKGILQGVNRNDWKTKALMVTELIGMGWEFTPTIVKGLGVAGLAKIVADKTKITWPKRKRKYGDAVNPDEAMQMAKRFIRYRDTGTSSKRKENPFKPMSYLEDEKNYPAPNNKSLVKMAYGKRTKMRSKSKRRTKSKTKKRKVKRRRTSNVTARKILNLINRKKNESTTQDYRAVDNANYSAGQNLVGDTNYDVLTRTEVRGMIDGTNPEIDGTSITYADLTQAESNSVIKLMGRSYIKLMVRNNYQYPCVLYLYHYIATDHTNTNFRDHTRTRYEDYVIDNLNSKLTTAHQNIMYGPSDIKSDKYKVLKKMKHTFEPAEYKEFYFPLKKGSFDCQEDNNIANTYHKGFSQGIYFRLHGHPAHGDAAGADENGTCLNDCELDIIFQKHYRYKVMKSASVRKSELGVNNVDTVGQAQMAVDSVQEADNVQIDL